MHRRLSFLAGLGGAIAAALGACTGGSHETASSSGAGASGLTGASVTVKGGGGTIGGSGGLAGGGFTGPCALDPDVDADHDGFTPAQGDCDDCDGSVNPGAVDVLVQVDQDCDGVASPPLPCDDGLALDDVDPMNGARAVELCQAASKGERRWGVLSARYVGADGAEGRAPGVQVGLLEGFGPEVHAQAGTRLLALSSGHARLPDQPDACGSSSCTITSYTEAPLGFPQVVPSCDGGTLVNDDVALELSIRAPTNARGYAFSFKFASFEYPYWVCTPYNDQFIALVMPPPAGSINGNISFDANKNPVSVNLGFFDVCDPATMNDFAADCGAPMNPSCPTAPDPYCPSGPKELTGTGFDLWGDAGATRWLRTTAPVSGGAELTLRFALWDTADQALDSTVLVDGFTWIVTGAPVGVATEPLPDPK